MSVAEVTRATCPDCGGREAVSTAGTLRRHPKGAPTPCEGSGTVVERAAASTEPMLAADAPLPPGYVAVTLVAHVPAPVDHTVADEAHRLFVDPDHLYALLDATPNTHLRLTVGAL